MKIAEKRALACRECGCGLPAPAATGRPRVYCSVPCRRAAELDLRRCQALLTRAQRHEQDAARNLATADKWEVPGLQRVLDFWRGEVLRLRTEVRELLAAGDNDESGANG